ncbi:MAG: hypothetical protein HYX90_09270, partial [Chloroflexi bacterium]|nr:hypothetical protein [Chloroflexota bacterium]
FWGNTYPAEGAVIGTQKIEVGDFTPPKVASVETVNPAGKNVPPAGSTTLPGPRGGMNEDGFYLYQPFLSRMLPDKTFANTFANT